MYNASSAVLMMSYPCSMDSLARPQSQLQMFICTPLATTGVLPGLACRLPQMRGV